jgi:hypothetical protein
VGWGRRVANGRPAAERSTAVIRQPKPPDRSRATAIARSSISTSNIVIEFRDDLQTLEGSVDGASYGLDQNPLDLTKEPLFAFGRPFIGVRITRELDNGY